MISSAQLIYKLNLQATFLEKHLNLPVGFGKDPLAKAIYQCFNFDDISARFSDEGEEINLSYLLENNKLKYLLICEIDDKELIKELHKEIEKMALRLEEQVIINITRTQLISHLYNLFGLDYESKYIIQAEELELSWQPYFKTLSNNRSVLFYDLQVNSIPFRLIATKFNLDEISVDTFIEQIKAEIKQSDHVAYENIESHIDWFSCSTALLTKADSDNTDELPVPFRIKDDEYVVFGFPLCPSILFNNTNPLPGINFIIKNTTEKQKFIINIEQQKLTLECLVIDDICDERIRLPKLCHQIKNNLLSHKDACLFPINFESGLCFFWIRPFAHMDFIENAL
tara:strand:- start:2377 stop:3399 length:1023 start_codon:yes stop_codon:yes gene_type:complete